MAVYGTQSAANERNTRAGRGIPSRGNGPLGLTLALSRGQCGLSGESLDIPETSKSSESDDIGGNAGWALTPPTTDPSAYPGPGPTTVTERQR